MFKLSDLPDTTGGRIEYLRKGRKLKQQELADKIHVSRTTIPEWQKTGHNLKTENLVALADTFGVSVDFLLCRENETTRNIHFIHEETGLSEAAIKKLMENKNRIMLHEDDNEHESFADTVSSIIEHNRFGDFISRLMQSRARRTKITKHKHQHREREKIENAHAVLRVEGYEILPPGKNNYISIFDAKQVISGIIDDLFRNEETGFFELRD